MKTSLRIAFVLFCLFLQGQLLANTVIVKGTVKDSANHYIANKSVKIYSTDSSNGGCLLSHTVVTNANGYYIDTLTCNGDIRKLIIIVENCDGAKITHDASLTGTSNIVENNFVICSSTPVTQPNPVNCKSQFTFSAHGTTVQFNSANALAPGDSIVSRNWIFGDSSAVLTGNRVDPSHVYAKTGSYTACLYIKTKNGCESKYCADFILHDTTVVTPTNCKAVFTYTIKDSTVVFNSAGSVGTSADDSIISRTWYYSDNNTSVSLSGNVITPSYKYAKPGTYNVYLVIKTKKGCESKFTLAVVIPAPVPPTGCKAVFTYTIKDSTVQFNSEGSVGTSADDSIISRAWYFAGTSIAGASASGNVVAPSYTYAKPGTYNVYLVIKTRRGCESSFTHTVVIPQPVTPTNCKAVFTYTIKDSLVVFNSAGSVGTSADDSIISRTWYYSDNNTSVSLGGNVITPSYKYAKPGTYNVYLVIKTKKGCESKFTLAVVIPAPVPPTGCKAIFTYTIKDSTVQFNSERSVGTSADDSIVSRAWYFAGTSTAGSSLSGNVVSPSYKYAKPGTYNVYLVIKTRKGCESSFTLTVVIPSPVPPTGCKAVFTYTLKDSTVQFNSEGSVGTSADDSIISRTWYYADNNTSVSLAGNVVAPSYKYAKPGTYNVYLSIKTKKGCESKFMLAVVIPAPVPPTGCKAVFTYTIKDSTVQFNSEGSVGTSADDSIVSRTWYYADNSTSVALNGNVVSPSYKYAKPGSYNVYLVIKTKKGCESKFMLTVVIPAPVLTNCKATFTYTTQAGTVKFNSAASKATSDHDTITSRIWIFGDSTAPLQGNSIDPTHSYTKSGKYSVTLYIKTKSGCESKYTETVTIITADCRVEAYFTAERISLKKVQFNSSFSTALPGDSIIQRNWKFGDNTILSGNEIKPVKEFPIAGIYNTCLQVRTLNGCEAQICKSVTVQDTVTTPQSSIDYIKIISINPNPVVTRMMATIYSRNTNVEAEISIYDIYGTRKLTIKKLLAQGNNIFEINTESLYHGPYFLRVTTNHGNDSKAFYKL